MGRCLLISISPEPAFSKVQKKILAVIATAKWPWDLDQWVAFVRPAVNNNNRPQQREKKAIKPIFCRLRKEVEVKEGALPLRLQKGW